VIHTDQERVIAIAGVFQAAQLTQQLAQRGFADQRPYNASFRSILVTDPENTHDVFGGVEHVKLGLETLAYSMSRGDHFDADVLRYAMTMVQLAKKVMRQPDIMRRFGDVVQQLTGTLHGGPEDNVDNDAIQRVAGLYQETISNLDPRIMVRGEPEKLADPDVAARIRAVLFAGIRAAILWLQVGGRNWQFIFKRKDIVSTAEDMLRRI